MFYRLLHEPLITVSLRKDFERATIKKDKQDVDAALYQAISELPQPNRDTLAFLMLHLQRVSSSPECEMPINSLAKIFGPTLIGYKSQKPSDMLSETKEQVAVSDISSNVIKRTRKHFMLTRNMIIKKKRDVLERESWYLIY